jgi:hypothetical protein
LLGNRDLLYPRLGEEPLDACRGRRGDNDQQGGLTRWERLAVELKLMPDHRGQAQPELLHGIGVSAAQQDVIRGRVRPTRLTLEQRPERREEVLILEDQGALFVERRGAQLEALR